MFIEIFPKQKPDLQIKIQQDEPYCSCFLFINSGSGSGLGSKLLAQQIDKIVFNIPIKNQNDIKIIDLHFTNLRKKQNKERGFHKLKKLTQQNKKSITVVCGGDGTVMWVVNQLKNFGIDPRKTALAIIPTGTGNDFSRSTNWGEEVKELLQQNFKQLKNLIRRWLNAKTSQFDIWDLTAQVQPDIGWFDKVTNGQSRSTSENTFRRSFANYCSFGIDAKIGYSFDKHRLKSRIGNMAVYGGIGLIKSISRTKTVDQLVQQLYIRTQTSDISVFKSKISSQLIQNKVNYILPNLQNILLLNINSYAGGVKNIWESGQDIYNNQHQVKKEIPSFQDGKIQMVSFNSATTIAMERSIGGFAKRIVQHEGPFIFSFRKYPQGSKHRTYLQVDGQYLRFNHPKRVVIQKSKLFRDSKIIVLINNTLTQTNFSC